MPDATSDREKQEQALSFAWGNLAVSHNHQPSKDVFRKLSAERYGWTDAEFEAWWARQTARST